MHHLHWVASMHMLGLPKVSHVMHVGQQAGHRLRADHRLKEEAGSHHRHHCPLRGVGGQAGGKGSSP